ncbi:MAG: 5'-methylthioadenosine/S-adenosylhomocysteine nucleosidase [Anaerolineales bacterium]
MKSVILISADAEWLAIRQILPQVKIRATALGETFLTRMRSARVRFYHGGWGRISAAATAQYVLDHYHPDLLINLGTCGGFAGRIQRGTILLVEKTAVYDILEQMTDPQSAIDAYTTTLDLSWLVDALPHPVQRGLLVSGDRDLLPEDIPILTEKYGAVAADWESGAIAWVAQRNRVRCLILRGVTDLVGPNGGEAYGNLELFQSRTREVMQTLIGQLPDWLELG